MPPYFYGRLTPPSEGYQIEQLLLAKIKLSFEPFKLKKNLCSYKIAQDKPQFACLRWTKVPLGPQSF